MPIIEIKLSFHFVSEMKMDEDDTKLQFSVPVASAAPGSKYKRPGSYVAEGEDAEITDFPFMASLQHIFSSNNDSFHTCGAALLDSTHILTAAHCVSVDNP